MAGKVGAGSRAVRRTIMATVVLAKAGNGYGSAVPVPVVSSSSPQWFGMALSWMMAITAVYSKCLQFAYGHL